MIALSITSIVLGLVTFAWAGSSPFTPPCALPFKAVAKEHDIDRVCPLGGSQSHESVTLQNTVKNNFCAKGHQDASQPIALDFGDFEKLEQAANDHHIAHGYKHLPKDRKGLHSIIEINGHQTGEGKLVSVMGYLVDPHYSDVDHGESVNCNLAGEAHNDIHIGLSPIPLELPKKSHDKALRERRMALLCKTIVVEVSPHFRPEAWEVPALNQIERDKTLVRVTGQLFYDASHSPCHDGKAGRGDPARSSLWEIHPIYKIETCPKKRADCLSGKGGWVAQ